MISIGERFNQYQGIVLFFYFAYVITRFRVQFQRMIWKICFYFKFERKKKPISLFV